MGSIIFDIFWVGSFGIKGDFTIGDSLKTFLWAVTLGVHPRLFTVQCHCVQVLWGQTCVTGEEEEAQNTAGSSAGLGVALYSCTFY